MKYKVKDFYKKYKNELSLKLLSNTFLEKQIRLSTKISTLDFENLSSYKGFQSDHILIIDSEKAKVFDINKDIKLNSFEKNINQKICFIIFTKNINPSKESLKIFAKQNILLFQSALAKEKLHFLLKRALKDICLSTINLAGTFLEVFNQGVLLTGESLVGKSETALSLIRKGHKFVSDDVVKIKKNKNTLIGFALQEDKYLMEIKDIGLIDIAKIYGNKSVRAKKTLNIVINLEKDNESQILKRVGLKEKHIDILNVKILYHTLFIKPQRDISLLIETLILNLQSTSKNFRPKKRLNLNLLEKIAERKSCFRETYQNF